MLSAWLSVAWMLAAVPAAGGPAPVPFVTIARGDHSGIDKVREVVVRGAADWKALWRQHAPEQAAPDVDFSKWMVVGVFGGEFNTGGFPVAITAIEREGGRLVVTWRQEQPPPDGIVAQVFTYPFHLVRTEQTGDTVAFRRIQGGQ
jgi:hypothetical protein